MHELGSLAALGEADRAQPAIDEPGEEPRRVSEWARADPELDVDQLRVPEDDVALGSRSGVVVDDPYLEAREPRRQLAGVRDRRRREHEQRLGAIREREPPQPPEDVRDVRAEHPAVDVRLVDDDHVEVVQHVAPAVVVRQDPDVEHVRVREDRVGAPTECARCSIGVSPS